MFLLSSLLVFLIVFFDQATKYFVITYFAVPYKINKYVSINFSLNRGVSWGLFSFNNTYLFALVGVLICAVMGLLIVHIIDRVKNRKIILGELFVLGGGLSNLLDRLLHQGVVDFISLSANGWHWPTFNIADSFIVLGVGIMFVALWNECE